MDKSYLHQINRFMKFCLTVNSRTHLSFLYLQNGDTVGYGVDATDLPGTLGEVYRASSFFFLFLFEKTTKNDLSHIFL
jgi:hypothetical protein